MSEITAALVRELREKSGAGMMECKKALEATGGDMEAAFDELRKSGLKTAAKKAGRDTGEGRVACALSDDGKTGAMVAIACETDFVHTTSCSWSPKHSLCSVTASALPAVTQKPVSFRRRPRLKMCRRSHRHCCALISS